MQIACKMHSFRRVVLSDDTDKQLVTEEFFVYGTSRYRAWELPVGSLGGTSCDKGVSVHGEDGAHGRGSWRGKDRSRSRDVGATRDADRPKSSRREERPVPVLRPKRVGGSEPQLGAAVPIVEQEAPSPSSCGFVATMPGGVAKRSFAEFLRVGDVALRPLRAVDSLIIPLSPNRRGLTHGR